MGGRDDDPWDDVGLDAAGLARAEAALAALAGNYLDWAANDVAALQAALAQLVAADAAVWPAAAARLFAVAHDIKGQAGTFGYGLLTRLGGALCRRLEAAPLPEAAALEAAAALVAAMAEVVERRLEGDGGDAGRALVARLKGLAPGLTDKA